MNRRAFLTALSGGLLAAPLAAEARKTVKALGLIIPPALLLRADQVIC